MEEMHSERKRAKDKIKDTQIKSRSIEIDRLELCALQFKLVDFVIFFNWSIIDCVGQVGNVIVYVCMKEIFTHGIWNNCAIR